MNNTSYKVKVKANVTESSVLGQKFFFFNATSNTNLKAMQVLK